MSFTEQLHIKDSNLNRFLSKHEDKAGARKCLELLTDTKPIHGPLLPAPTPAYWSCAGITIDYLIRYIANGNNLLIEETVAGEGWEKIPYSEWGGEIQDLQAAYSILMGYVGKAYLDGRVVDELAVYSGTALAVLEGLVRRGRLPRSFGQEISSKKISKIEKLPLGNNHFERKCLWLFDDYCFETLSWEFYVQDILNMASLFTDTTNNLSGELYGAKFPVLGKSLGYGGHFDLLVQLNGRYILSDIKASTKKLEKSSLRQLISYILSHDTNMDGFNVSDAGIYYARSGGFRYLPVSFLINQCLPAFTTLEDAKSAFREQ
jgi:hypothetical protein